MMDPDELQLREEALVFIEQHLGGALKAAQGSGVNPAAALYGLLECGMRVAQAHFPDHANQLFASATQMVFEAHQDPTQKQ